MANDTETRNDPSATSLVSGIISDAQELMKQQFQLLTHEVKEDLRKTREGAESMALGGTLLFLGGLLLCFMLVFLLERLSGLDLWACYAIVGGVLAGIGGGLFAVVRRKLAVAAPLRDSTQALEENLQWIAKPK